MSKARLVITAVTAEGLTQGEAARRYGVSQGWVSKLLARYREKARRRSRLGGQARAHPRRVAGIGRAVGTARRRGLAPKAPGSAAPCD
jgi:hypothetical protein